MTTTEASSGEDGPEDSAPTMEASEDGKGYTTRLRYQRQQRRRWRLDAGLEGSPTMTTAPEEEDSNDEGGVCGGQGLYAASEGL